jgi:diguanylate cyclase (GGDEF)-like protein
MTKEDLIALQQKVTMLRAEGKYKETIENCYNLLEAGVELKNYKSVLTAYINLGASFYCIGDIDSAFNNLIAFEEICNKHGDDFDRLNLHNILFLLHEYRKDYTKAKDTLKKTIELGEKLKKYNIASNACSNYSHVFIAEKAYDKALEMTQEGVKFAKLQEPYYEILELRVKLNMARAYIGLKDYAASKALIDGMSSNPILDTFIREKAQCCDLLAHWYLEQNLYKEAFEALSEAKALVESYEDLYLLKTIQEERCRLCELMKDISMGYTVQKEYIALLNNISKKELEQTALKLEIKRDIASLEKRVNMDQLTGLYNRSYIETTVDDLLKQAYEKNESLTCIVFDIDRFKSINDKYGHLFGDEVIKQVSRACSSILRGDDFIGRFGGDEFVVILKGASIRDGEKKAKQLLEIVRNLDITRDGKTIPITLSIGVTDNLSLKELNFCEFFNIADMRLYKAKERGRNQVCAAS